LLLTPQQMPQRLLTQKVDEGVTLSKHSILNKFILASMSFGLLAGLVTWWRDRAIGIFPMNSLMNLSLVAVLGVVWITRNRLTVKVKSAILFCTFLFVATKNILLFGPHSAGIIFLGFGCMVIALIFEIRWTVIISLMLSLIIPIRAYLHFAGIYPVDQDFQLLLSQPSMWAANYTFFLLTGFIVAFGVGQLRLELNMNFKLLREAVTDLEVANKQLKHEIELKNAYEEDLLVSTKKFQGLFEGSRDGVLLLNSKAEIIEANQAAIEMSGYSLAELKAISIFSIVEESYRKESMQRFESNMRGEIEPELLEVEINTKNGLVVPVEINSNLILAEEELMILSTVRDISYRKLAENDKFNAALAAEEKERARFSRDLHDDLGPVFSTLNLYLQTLGNKETDPAKKAILRNLSEIVDSAVKQVREISHNLSPYLLRDAGLIEAIRTHLKKFSLNGIDAQLDVRDDMTLVIPQPTQIVIYRVLLELLNNSLKHAQADKIRIQLLQSAKEVIFIYTDNGKGFDPQKLVNSGIGLKNIENRVKALKGSLRTQNDLNGMTTTVKIPL
jgi:PAS domain S-box-containing protein